MATSSASVQCAGIMVCWSTWHNGWEGLASKYGGCEHTYTLAQSEPDIVTSNT